MTGIAFFLDGTFNSNFYMITCVILFLTKNYLKLCLYSDRWTVGGWWTQAAAVVTDGPSQILTLRDLGSWWARSHGKTLHGSGPSAF